MTSGVELATAWIRLVPTTEGVQENVTKAFAPAEAAGEEAGKSAGGRFSGAAKVAMLAGLAGLTAGVVKIFQTGMEELKFGEQINAQTDQLIENTGFAGTVEQINKMTLAMSQVSGISEEELQAAGNNILKFGDVSTTTYQRAVSSLNDLGASGKDVAGTSEALGKALADPANAAALLKRQGVLLNDEQKSLIDNFTAAGDKAGAQGVILDALESTYGGMAEAAGGTLQGNLNKLNNAFENLSGDLVSMAMPAIEGFIGMLQGLVAWLSDNQAVIIAIAAIIGVTLVAAFFAWAASIWATTIALLANPIVWIILAIIALIAAVVLLVMNWDQVVAWITDIWSGFISWITGVIEGFVGWWNGIWAAVGAWIASVWEGIVAAVTGFFQRLALGLFIIGTQIMSWWNGLWKGIASFFGGVWDGILAAIDNVKNAFGRVFGAIGDVVRGAFEGVVGIIKGVINNIIGAVNGVIGGINGVAGAIGAAIGVSIRIPSIPMLATGGTITRSGSVIVGERGPELLTLPRGASVNPDISASSAPIYVQNPFTGDYLLARVGDIADASSASTTAGFASARRGGLRR